MLEANSQIVRVTLHHHVAKSQSGSKTVQIYPGDCKRSCDCSTHKFQKTRCKHILAVTACVNESKVAVFDDEPLEEVAGRSI